MLRSKKKLIRLTKLLNLKKKYEKKVMYWFNKVAKTTTKIEEIRGKLWGLSVVYANKNIKKEKSMIAPLAI